MPPPADGGNTAELGERSRLWRYARPAAPSSPRLTRNAIDLLHNSGHVITLDSEWEQVAQQTADFVEAHSSAERLVP